MKFVTCTVVICCAVSFSFADDPPNRRVARARAKDEPPPCLHVAQPKSVASKSVRRRTQPPSMPQMFDQMMDSMARNPAGGFADVMKEQEIVAVRQTSLTVAEERRIGRQQRDMFLRTARTKGYTVREVAKDTDYLKALVARFVPRMKNGARYPDIEVTLIDAPIPDGQSFPGGFLVFTTALLDEPDEATVAGVVAHELAHLDRGHLNEYARREKLASTAFRPSPDAMANPALFMSRGMALGSLMMDPFRPEHEHEADCVAATWLYQEGYDPRALADFFTRMNRRNRDQPDAPFLRIARSHPYSLDRRRAVLERLAQLRRWKSRDDLELASESLKERKVKNHP